MVSNMVQYNLHSLRTWYEKFHCIKYKGGSVAVLRCPPLFRVPYATHVKNLVVTNVSLEFFI